MTDSTPKRPQWLDVTFFGLFLVCLLIGFGTGWGGGILAFAAVLIYVLPTLHRPGQAERRCRVRTQPPPRLDAIKLGASGPALRVRRGEI